MKRPSLRGLYDAVDRQVAPRAEAFARTERAAALSAVVMGARRAVGKRVNAVSARVLHAANLPAGTDIARVRRQLGELDREVRRLRLELARDREEVTRDAEHRPEGGARPGPA